MPKLYKYKIPKYNHVSRTLIPSLDFYPQNINFKPKGFWFGIERDWLKFLKDELGYPIKVGRKYVYMPDKHYLYEVRFRKEKILKISSFKDLEKFQKEYGVPPDSQDTPYHYINWAKVAESYSGFMVSKNYEKIRKQTKKHTKPDNAPYLWFSMLDGNTGCIWSPHYTKVTKKAPIN